MKTLTRKVNQNYEYVTSRGNCFVFKSYKDNGYHLDIYKQSNIDGKTLTHWSSSRHDRKDYLFMTCNNNEIYLDHNY